MNTISLDFAVKRRRALPLFLAAVLLIITFTAPSTEGVFADDDDRIHLSGVSLKIGDSGTLAPTINADGTEFTFSDTNGADIENELANLDGSDRVLFYFVADVNTFLYGETGSNWGNGDQSKGRRINFMNMQPYDTDPDYVIFNFTLRAREADGSDGGKATAFTLRIRKWESQYEPEVLNRWFNTSMTIGTHISGDNWSSAEVISSKDFTPVEGQDHLLEYVVATDVTTPYYLDVKVTPHYKTTAYLDGSQFTATEAAYGFLRRLEFTDAKPSYDFKVDPGTAFDSKHTTYVATTWRLRIVPAKKSDSGTLKDKDGKTIAFTISSGLNDRVWTGKQIKPKLTLKAGGKTLKLSTDYSVSYGKNKDIGKGTITVKGKGNYSGSKTASFNILPKRPTGLKLTAGKKSLKVKWTKVSRAQKATGYQIMYRYKSGAKWSAWLTKTFKVNYKAKAATVTKTIKGLKAKKSYQVRVVAYTVIKSGASKGAYHSAPTSTKAKKTN
jgi:hypothetical protein